MRSLDTALVLSLVLLSACTEPAARPDPAPQRDPAFAAGALCARCHSASPGASALRSATGDDISPHGLWKATLMANSLRDPYFRAQFARELEAAPAAAGELGGLCLRCHAPMVHHQARLDGSALPPIAEVAADPLGLDGVSCTLCHQARAEKLGTDESFAGRLEIRADSAIYGPYPEPFAGPMRMQTGFTPQQGAHVQTSALCGACHTLSTQHAAGATPFLEQSPYLEWRNSVFSDEQGASAESRTCQQCHMPDEGTTRIARMPGGGDFNIALRPNVRAHSFVGGNAFVLELLDRHRGELGVEASSESLVRAAAATRRNLAQETASVEVLRAERAGSKLRFDVRVANRTGHKFPAGYPSRRAWLEVEARSGGRTFFHSGGADERGRIAGVPDERALPHFDRVRDPAEVVVYELRALDPQGKRTTQLSRMASVGKDNRLLPRGWRADGPHAQDTRPVGTEGDADFAGGEDLVHFEIALPPEASGRIVIYADLWYQTIPPGWADDLRGLAAPEARAFLRMYDAAPPAPEPVARCAGFVE